MENRISQMSSVRGWKKVERSLTFAYFVAASFDVNATFWIRKQASRMTNYASLKWINQGDEEALSCN